MNRSPVSGSMRSHKLFNLLCIESPLHCNVLQPEQTADHKAKPNKHWTANQNNYFISPFHWFSSTTPFFSWKGITVFLGARLELQTVRVPLSAIYRTDSPIHRITHHPEAAVHPNMKHNYISPCHLLLTAFPLLCILVLTLRTKRKHKYAYIYNNHCRWYQPNHRIGVLTMSNSKHTPGPWRVGDAGFTVFGPPNGTPSPETIATVRQGKINARLIAAAPDLYEAAKRVLIGTVARDECEDANGNVYPEFKALESALNKAEGK